MPHHLLTCLDLLDFQIEALFTHNEAGQTERINEPNGRPAPRFFLGRTAEGNRWRVRHDLPPRIAEALVNLAEKEPVMSDLAALPESLDQIFNLLNDDAPAEIGHQGPAFWIPQPMHVPDGVTRITRENWYLLSELPGWSADIDEGYEAGEPRFAVVEDGVAVAICASSRNTTRAAEAGVETLPAFRGRGYASRVVQAWAAAVQQSGRVAMYSTSWDNLASQAIARRLGMQLYASDLSIR